MEEKDRDVNRRCPKCGSQNDSYTSIDKHENKPKPGSMSICVYCAAVSQFTQELKLVLMSEKEIIDALKGDVDLIKNYILGREAVKRIIANRLRQN